MNKVIESNRLLFQTLTIDDHQYFHKLVTNPFGRKYLFDDHILSEEETIDILRTNERYFLEKSLGLWKIIEKDSFSPVGVTGLWFFFEEPQAQLLYVLSPDYTGKGYATESSKEVIKYAFTSLNYKYITASFDKMNTASKQVCERLNMKRCKELVVDGNCLLFYRLENTQT